MSKVSFFNAQYLNIVHIIVNIILKRNVMDYKFSLSAGLFLLKYVWSYFIQKCILILHTVENKIVKKQISKHQENTSQSFDCFDKLPQKDVAFVKRIVTGGVSPAEFCPDRLGVVIK